MSSDFNRANQLKKEEKLDDLRILARELELSGKFEEAISYYQKVIEIIPKDVETIEKVKSLREQASIKKKLLESATLARKQGNKKLALQVFEQAIKTYPQHIDAYVQAAIELRNAKRFAEAEEKLKEALEKEPDRLQALFELGILYRQQWKRDLALEQFERIIKQHPHFLPAYIQAGIELRESESFDLALLKFQKVIEQESDNCDALVEQGITYRRQGNRELALQSFEKAIQKCPENTKPYVEAALELEDLEHFTEAEAKLQKALEIEPNNFSALYRHAYLARKEGKKKLALRRLENILQKYPTQLSAHFQAGIELRGLEKFEEAQKKFQYVLSREPNHYGARIQQAIVNLYRLEELEQSSPSMLEKNVKETAISINDILYNNYSSYPSLNIIYPLARNATQLLRQFQKLQGLFEQYVLGNSLKSDKELINYRLLKAIKLLEEEDRKLKNSKFAKVAISVGPLGFKQPGHATNYYYSKNPRRFQTFTQLSSAIKAGCSSNLILGNDRYDSNVTYDQCLKFLDGLMEEEKKFCAALKNRLRRRNVVLEHQQYVGVIADCLFFNSFHWSRGLAIMDYTEPRFVSFEKLEVSNGLPNTNVNFKNYQTYIIDPRLYLEEVALAQEKLNSYYPDDIIFALPTVGRIWGAYQNWGHVIIDQIPSLILYKKLQLSCKIFVPQITDYHWEVFNYLNISQDIIVAEQQYKFQYLVVGRYKLDMKMINLYRELCSSVLAQNKDKTASCEDRKIYMSRKFSKKRRMDNEEEVEEAMRDLGFVVLYMEQLTLKEKVMFLHNASIIVTPHGASLSNLFFLGDNSSSVKLISIVPPGLQTYVLNEPHLYQMCSLMRIDYYMLLGIKTSNSWITDIKKLTGVVNKLVNS